VQFNVPFGRPSILEPEIAEVIDTLKSGWLISGPKVKRFEDEFSAYTGAKHAIALNSCTAALQLSLVAAGIGPGDEVITTPLTFVATANAIVHTGAVPVFADIDPETLNISPERIEERITPRTRAVMPVHMLGRPADLDPILELAAPQRIAVISDAAHATETHYHGAHVATAGLASAFSFQASKTVTTGEGGMVTTSDDDIAHEIRVLRSHGLDKDAWRRADEVRDSSYEAVEPGFNYRLSDIAAALGIHQLRRVEEQLAVRERHVRRYDEAFAGTVELVRPSRLPAGHGNRHAQYLYTVQLCLERLSIDRDQFVVALKSLGIGCGVHYRAVHLHRYYQERFGLRRGDYPAAEHVSDRTVSLPLSAAMTSRDVDDVVEAVESVIGANRR